MDVNSISAVLPYLIAFGAAGLTTMSLTPVVGRLAGRIGAIDKPEARKVHEEPIPRLGGLGIFAGFLVGLAVFLAFRPEEFGIPLIAVVVGATVIVVVGILDDVKNLPAKYKFLGQLVAALIVIGFGPRIEFIASPSGGVLNLNPILSAAVTLFWIVSLVNVINFIDGLDGLAAGVASIAAFTLAIYAGISGHMEGAFIPLALAAAAIGFLRHNFNPASIFMGDSGSMLLGFVLGAVTVSGVTKGIAFVTLLVPLIIVAIPIFDAAFAIIRRLLSGKPITEPDRGHVHHRLLHKGHSQRQTVVRIYLWSVALSAAALALTLAPGSLRNVVIVFLILLSLLFVHSLGLFQDMMTAFIDRTTPPRSRKDYTVNGEQVAASASLPETAPIEAINNKTAI